MTAEADRPAVSALVIPATRAAYTRIIHPTLPVLQGLVGGVLESVSRGGWHAYVRGEGKLAGLPANPIASGLLFPGGEDVVAGTAVVLGDGRDGGEVDVPADVAEQVLTGPARVRQVTIGGPGEIIAAVPALFAYPPAESLVALALDAGIVTAGARFDLVPMARPAGVFAVAARVARMAGESVVLVVIGGGPDGTDHPLPWHQQVADLKDLLGLLGKRVLPPLWTALLAPGARWACYDRTEAGRLPDPATTTVAAACASAGRPVLASRIELVELLVADPEETLARRAALLATAASGDSEQGSRLVDAAIAAAGGGQLPDRDEQVVALAAALADSRVHDHAITYCVGQQAEAAELLWLALVRATPPSHRADPAVLLGLTAYLRGDTPLAAAALAVARQAAPAHELARLVQTCLDHGLHANQLRAALTEITPGPAD
jgi:hypothetical protein